MIGWHYNSWYQIILLDEQYNLVPADGRDTLRLGR